MLLFVCVSVCAVQSQCAWVYLRLSRTLFLFFRLTLCAYRHFIYINTYSERGEREFEILSETQNELIRSRTRDCNAADDELNWLLLSVPVWPQTKSKTLLLSLWKIALKNVKIISCDRRHTHTHTDVYTLPVTHRLSAWRRRRGREPILTSQTILFLTFCTLSIWFNSHTAQLAAQLNSIQFNLIRFDSFLFLISLLLLLVFHFFVKHVAYIVFLGT